MDHIICDATGEPCYMLKACDNERGCVSLRERQRTEMQTREQIKRAAAKWQGASSTPCCEDRTPYFEANWRYLPGLRKYVTEQQ